MIDVSQDEGEALLTKQLIGETTIIKKIKNGEDLDTLRERWNPKHWSLGDGGSR